MLVLVTQSCPTLCNPKDCSLPGSSVHGILQARIPEWVAIPFSSGSSQHKDWTLVFYIAGRFFTVWVAGKPIDELKTQANDVPIDVWAEKDQEVLASNLLLSTRCLKCDLTTSTSHFHLPDFPGPFSLDHIDPYAWSRRDSKFYPPHPWVSWPPQVDIFEMVYLSKPNKHTTPPFIEFYPQGAFSGPSKVSSFIPT